jgi:glutamate/tyrosine decarboxylase-like PLP-dependent enzyme
MAGPRYFGFVIGGAVPASVSADWMTAAWDQNAFGVAMAPAAAAAERVAGEWMLDLLGLPAAASVGLPTGAGLANAVGIAAGRHAVLQRAGWDVEARGLYGAPEIEVIAGAEAHATIDTALAYLGLGRERVTRIPADGQGAMRADALAQAVAAATGRPVIVCAQAGNVNTGAFDPFGPIADAVAGHGNAWMHVDGAFGLWAAAVPRLRHHVSDVDRADSWATDAHKWLNVPYDSGLVFCRDAASHRAALRSRAAAYLTETEAREPDQLVPDFSRRARGIEVWAALLALGREGLCELLERTCAHARRFAEALAADGHAVLNDVVLNQVLVSFGAPERTRRVIEQIQRGGVLWCGGTVWQGQTAMRISVSSWATTAADVERSLDGIRAAVARAG